MAPTLSVAEMSVVCAACTMTSVNTSLETGLLYREPILSEGEVHEGVRALLLRLSLSQVVRGNITKLELGALHHAAAGINDAYNHRSLRSVLRPTSWDGA